MEVERASVYLAAYEADAREVLAAEPAAKAALEVVEVAAANSDPDADAGPGGGAAAIDPPAAAPTPAPTPAVGEPVHNAGAPKARKGTKGNKKKQQQTADATADTTVPATQPAQPVNPDEQIFTDETAKVEMLKPSSRKSPPGPPSARHYWEAPNSYT